MTFDVKYNIGDLVYFMKDNRVCEGHIREIRYSYNGRYYSESYYMKEDTGMHPPLYSVLQLFSTKEELINSLFE